MMGEGTQGGKWLLISAKREEDADEHDAGDQDAGDHDAGDHMLVIMML